jgi:epoxide hydrolase 4
MLPLLPGWFLRWNRGAGIESVIKMGAARFEAISKAYLGRCKAEMLKPGAIAGGLKYYRATVCLGKKNIEFMNKVTDTPIQMIWGVADSALSVTLLDGMEQYASNIQVHKLPGVGHWVSHEAAAETTRLLMDWHVPK